MSASSESAGGRSLKKSVVFGLILAFGFLFSIIIVRELFILLAAVAAAAGAAELSKAMRIKGWYVARPALIVGSLAIMPITYYWGSFGQWVGAFSLVLLLIVWRMAHLLTDKSTRTSFVKVILDFAAATFIVIYVPLTMSFAMLMLRNPNNENPDGYKWILTFVITVIFTDSFGYLIGRRVGKTRIAPGVSPKKSLEGLIASIVFGGGAAVGLTVFLIGGTWLQGLLLGAVVIFAAVFGDLAESLIKRDLGVKDMSSWLPGHGGVMDRLDSILPATLVTYLFWQLSSVLF